MWYWHAVGTTGWITWGYWYWGPVGGGGSGSW